MLLKAGLQICRVDPYRFDDPVQNQLKLFLGGSLCVFDVGAAIGSVSERYLECSGSSRDVEIHCFEPHPAYFKRLSSSLAHDNRIVLNKIALSYSCGVAWFFPGDLPFISSTKRPRNEAEAEWGRL